MRINNLDLLFSRADVAKRTDVGSNNVLVIIRNRVYDIGRYLNIATENRRPKPDTAFLTESFTQALLLKSGGDATAAVQTVPNADDLIRCMDKLFLAGTVQESFAAGDGCVLFNPVLYAIAFLIFLPLLAKFTFAFFAGMGLSACCSSETNKEANILAFIACYAEPEGLLRETIESVAGTDYNHNQKMLFIVCDGNVVIKNGNVHTYQAVLDILGHRGPGSELKSYIAVGEKSRSFNNAKVFSGTYSFESKRIPFIVVAKMGAKHETKRPGNRGKRDSLMIMLNFLNNIRRRTTPMTPLEYELYQHCQTVFRNDLRNFEYVLALDGDTRLERISLKNMVRKMDSDWNLAILAGQSKLSNSMESFPTVLQSYPFYLRDHLGMQVDSTFGSMTLMPGKFQFDFTFYF
jgi:chitin synthase